MKSEIKSRNVINVHVTSGQELHVDSAKMASFLGLEFSFLRFAVTFIVLPLSIVFFYLRRYIYIQ